MMEDQEYENCYYLYTRNGVEYATPDYDFAIHRANGDVYRVSYNPSEINAPTCN